MFCFCVLFCSVFPIPAYTELLMFFYRLWIHLPVEEDGQAGAPGANLCSHQHLLQ